MYIIKQDGVISLFIVVAMIILLIFSISVYFLINSKLKIQEAENLQYRAIYSKNYEEITNIEYAAENEIIPIYNIDELNIAGTNNYIQINKKIYQCGREKSYVLKDNIIVDINEKLNNRLVGFNDYKLYSSTYTIDNASYDLYYYYNKNYWKTICYKKCANNDYSVKNNKYEDKEFSVLSDLSFNPNETYMFLIVIIDNKGEIIKEEKISQTIRYNKINSIEEIDAYKSNKDNLQENYEFYIFIYTGDSI